jgi:nucleotide-binding universal stress UspA family protein
MDVLVPFDLTQVSERALAHAVATVGPRADATIHAVHFGESPEQAEYAAREAIEEITDGCAARVEVSFAGGDRQATADAGRVAERILDVAEDVDPDVVVVGRHPRSTIESLFAGNTADHLVEAGAFPVTVVP